MLTLNRYDATSASDAAAANQSNQAGAPSSSSSRLAALAQRKRKRQSEGPGDIQIDSNTITSIVNEAETTDAKSSPAATAPPASHIHPSRLAAAPLLARSAKKAAAAAGVAKEKTKAKQRYLKKKNARRKAKKKATPGKKKEVERKDETGLASAVSDGAHEADESSDESSSSSSSSDEDSDDEMAPADLRPAQAQTTAGDSRPIDKSEGATERAVASGSSASSSSSDSSSSASSSESESDSGLDDSPIASTSSATEAAAADNGDLKTADPKEEAMEAQRTFLEPLARGKQATEVTSAQALQSLAAQGLPRGMAEPQVVEASTRKAIEQDEASEEESKYHADISARLGARLDAATTKRLREIGVVEWFAVQTAVIPHLLSIPALPSPFAPPRDLCVSAPTGSGKTLAYAIPIVAHLKTRVVTRLRALVVLPTRDLVAQVRETLETLAKGTGLRIGGVTGAQSFSQEQTVLMDTNTQESKLDVLISTPGRLLDHLQGTQGFTLQFLRFLVIDEADRLLGQSFNNWAQRLRDSIEGKGTIREEGEEIQEPSDTIAEAAAFSTARQDSITQPQTDAAYDPVRPQPVVQKLLFSATLTREAGKLAELGLRDPVFIDVRDEAAMEKAQRGAVDGSTATLNGSFSLPATLQEHMLVVPTAMKPLHLLHLLFGNGQSQPLRRTLIFTKSVESSQRLVRLLEEFLRSDHAGPRLPSLTVADYSSDLSPSRRRDLLTRFRSDAIDVLVASDLISRGIDLPLVENVISYDVPVDAAKYVHRVGRTARANRAGSSWSLVEEQEARHFKKMLRDGLGRLDKVKKVKVKAEELEPMRPRYEVALDAVTAAFSRAG
ncbi:unnamed protein product [Jaminaea pallidilutea]